jgi:small GTP-binding protein
MGELKTREFNLVVLGNSKVGKTTMIERVVNKETTEPTRNQKNYHFKFELDRNTNTNVYFNIWDVDCDTNLQVSQKFEAAIFMYDITNLKSFKLLEDSLEDWILKLKRDRLEQLVMIMVGNKYDCSDRQVENDVAKELAKKNGMLLLEISAKKRSNTDLLFKNIGHQLIGKLDQGKGKGTIVNNLPNRLWNNKYRIMLLFIASLVISLLVIVPLVFVSPYFLLIFIVLLAFWCIVWLLIRKRYSYIYI